MAFEPGLGKGFGHGGGVAVTACRDISCSLGHGAIGFSLGQLPGACMPGQWQPVGYLAVPVSGQDDRGQGVACVSASLVWR